MAVFDAVVIGRNEGARLQDSLRAVLPLARRVIYVDSGSRDGSPDAARALGAEVIDLDPSQPFTAARGRNTGFQALQGDRAEFVQFIDGDCILNTDWPQTALDFLRDHPRAALAIGRYREEAPETSVYNWLTHWEWQKPTGPKAGGIGTFMVRSAAFEQSGGFRDKMIAAEDDELFERLRKAGWDTWGISAPMCSHDANLHDLRPWLRRMLRAGHSFSELGAMHQGAAAMSRRRALLWAGVLPVMAVALVLIWWPASMGVALAYLASILRQAWRFTRMGLERPRALQAAGLVMLAKFTNLAGMTLYWGRKLRRSDARIIEYK